MNIKEAIEIVTNMLQIRPTGYPILDIEREALQTLIDNVEANPAPQIDIEKISYAIEDETIIDEALIGLGYEYENRRKVYLLVATVIKKALEAK